jgi:GntR family transcriptional regulator, phosphonate transport system regulatory protein
MSEASYRPDPRTGAAQSQPVRTASIARRTGATVWSQIEDELAREIVAGTRVPGARLGTEHELAARFRVNRHTVRQALASLAAKGIVRIEHGRGTFVEDRAIDYMLGRRTRFTENLIAAGVEGRREVLRTFDVDASTDMAMRLRVKPRTRLTVIEALAQARGRPIGVAQHYFPARRFAGIADAFARTRSVSKALREFGVEDYSRKVSFVTARLPEERIARLLRQSPTRPVLHVESVNVDTDGRPIEYGRTEFAGDFVQLVVSP